MRELLSGAPGAYRDTVLMNAGAALVVAGTAATLQEGATAAANAIDSGQAAKVLDTLVHRLQRIRSWLISCAEIEAYKRDEIAAAKSRLPLSEVVARLGDVEKPRGFPGRARELSAPPVPFRADRGDQEGQPVERTDPRGFRPAVLARPMRKAAPACLSVLTDTPSFQGAPEFLTEARAAVTLPALRKDFMFEPYQVHEARLWGADAILLIMASLGDDDARRLEETAFELGMDVLVEVHDEAETERALKLSSRLIGINNRDLQDLRSQPRHVGTAGEAGAWRPASGQRKRHLHQFRLPAPGRSWHRHVPRRRKPDAAGRCCRRHARAALRRRRNGPLIGMTDRPSLTHIGAKGEAHMVDVGAKAETERTAIAEGAVTMQAATLKMILDGNARKGDVLGTARIAGIMAAKKAHELIPLCHPLLLTKVSVDIEADEALPGLRVKALARVTGKTGVEMEALTAASVACLTIYDMAKAVDRGMRSSAACGWSKSPAASPATTALRKAEADGTPPCRRGARAAVEVTPRQGRPKACRSRKRRDAYWPSR